MFKKKSFYRILTAGILTLSVAVAICCCCFRRTSIPRSCNSVYFWKTTLKLTPVERTFISEHHIGKVYCRFFDVVMKDGATMPNATLCFTKDGFSDSTEIVPTIYITVDCLRKPQPQLDSLLYTRIIKMCQVNKINNVHEIQIDYDWTKSTQDEYFALLKRLRQRLSEQDLGLSVTIRLHQLALAPPPADYGVLMLYNTGSAADPNCENPILDEEVIRQYLRYLHGYPLPLSAAYPNYQWDLLFRRGKFQEYIYNQETADILPSDTILHCEVPFNTIRNVHDAIQETRADVNSQVIIYHLDERNIQHYTYKEYETLYHN